MGQRIAVIPSLDPACYSRHALHGENCVWVEKNCYVDVWIELLHSLRLNPIAMLHGAVAVDFEGDQWTFYKPSLSDLWDLYGIDVQELTVWRPLIDHAAEHLAAGKFISTEADAFWLPDTAGTDYRQAHTKTTIVLNDLDVTGKRLGYFHNAGYYGLEGDDFDGLFRVGVAPDPTFLPLYADLIRVDRIAHRSDQALASLSEPLLRKALQRLPTQNPVERFADSLKVHLPLLAGQGLAHYHAWAFANTRQLGLAFELAAAYFQWLQPFTSSDYTNPHQHCAAIASLSKALILKGARVVNSGSVSRLDETLASMSSLWTQFTCALR